MMGGVRIGLFIIICIFTFLGNFQIEHRLRRLRCFCDGDGRVHFKGRPNSFQGGELFVILPWLGC